MNDAELWDDVYNDDPAVNRLEAKTTAMLGKEAAVFIPSGTMSNIGAVLSNSHPGSVVLVGDNSHIFHKGSGVMEALGRMDILGGRPKTTSKPPSGSARRAASTSRWSQWRTPTT